MNSKWPGIYLGLAFAVLGLLHAFAWLFIVFVYHANTIRDVARSYLPVYGYFGQFGVWLFLAIVFLDFVTALALLFSAQRGRFWGLLSGVLNLPIIPLGSLVGVLAIWTITRHRESP